MLSKENSQLRSQIFLLESYFACFRFEGFMLLRREWC